MYSHRVFLLLGLPATTTVNTRAIGAPFFKVVLLWLPPKAEPGVRTWVCSVRLGGDPQEHVGGIGK